MSVKIGLELFEKNFPSRFSGARVGLLVHPASVNKQFRHAVDLLLSSKKCRLTALFGPQHGFLGQTQDNMVEWKGFRDRRTRLPVFSLYGETRKPKPEMLKHVDLMVVDLQDIGSRYYTFIWTMELCQQACLETGKALVVLDRPNPIGGEETEGTVLQTCLSSFVGNRPLPIRHGMTIGEIAHYLRDEYYPGLDFHTVAMERWNRKLWFDRTGLPWVMPSPNMPSLDTTAVYPGMCLLEGTNLSEGRGTTRPFEIFGAPFVDPDRLLKRLGEFSLPGAVFRSLYFQPTFQKHKGKLCGGAYIHVTDRGSFKPFKTGVAVLKAAHDLYPKQFQWKKPPYEYEDKKMPIDILAGDYRLKRGIERGEKLEHMEEWWMEECVRFNRTVRRRYLIYD
ncbi:MAG TPA: DUF1343 domain-containing protein [Thermodesulfovibrionales bacterium]|nr:DUF1343 domain-containing protein [Thermodesulfovibrionales bacterium]